MQIIEWVKLCQWNCIKINKYIYTQKKDLRWFFKLKVLIDCKEPLLSPSQGHSPALKYGEGQSISKGEVTLLGNSAVGTAIQISMETLLGGDELAGSASTLLGEKTASISENAVLAFRFFPARFSKGGQRAVSWLPTSGKEDTQGQRFPKNGGGGFPEHQVKKKQRSQPGDQVWAESPLSNSTLFETLTLLRPPAAWCQVQVPCCLQPLPIPVQAGLFASGALLNSSLSQVPNSCLLASDHLPQGLHVILLCSVFPYFLRLSSLTDKTSVSNSDNLSTLLPLVRRTECAV